MSTVICVLISRAISSCRRVPFALLSFFLVSELALSSCGCCSEESSLENLFDMKAANRSEQPSGWWFLLESCAAKETVHKTPLIGIVVILRKHFPEDFDVKWA